MLLPVNEQLPVFYPWPFVLFGPWTLVWLESIFLQNKIQCKALAASSNTHTHSDKLFFFPFFKKMKGIAHLLQLNLDSLKAIWEQKIKSAYNRRNFPRKHCAFARVFSYVSGDKLYDTISCFYLLLFRSFVHIFFHMHYLCRLQDHK